MATSIDEKRIRDAVRNYIDPLLTKLQERIYGSGNSYNTTVSKTVLPSDNTYDGDVEGLVTAAGFIKGIATFLSTIPKGVTQTELDISAGPGVLVSATTAGARTTYTVTASGGSGGGVLGAFRATLSGAFSPSDSAFGGSDSKLVMSIIDLNVGGYYNGATNQRWTPPSGLVIISAQAALTNTDANGIWVYIRKNGATDVARAISRTNTGFNTSLTIANVVDQANGSDYYELWCGRWTGGQFTTTAVPSGERTFWNGVCYGV